jgi:hypothetical protein
MVGFIEHHPVGSAGCSAEFGDLWQEIGHEDRPLRRHGELE